MNVDNQSIDDMQGKGKVKAGPGQEEAAAPGSKQSMVQGRMEEVEVDYSKGERVLKEGLGTGASRMGVKGEGGVEETEGPPVEAGERIRNPFAELAHIRPGTRVERDARGQWKTDDGVTYGDLQYEKAKAKVLSVHPDMEEPVGSGLVDKILGTKPGEEVELKTEVADYISKRDEARRWWLEKMKAPPSTNRPGTMMGVEVPERNAMIDHATMMRQYGPGHLPSTTAEWEIHETWEHKRKYLSKAPTQPRWVKWSKRAFYFTTFSFFASKVISNQTSGYKADVSYRHSKAVDVTHLRNKHSPPYISRSTYPYV